MTSDGQVLQLPHGPLRLPTFLPDATRGVVRAVDALDLVRCGVRALQTNVFHLMQRPGSTTIRTLGGLHRMMGWQGPIVADSGGFQVFSLIRQKPRYGGVTDRGVFLRPAGSSRKVLLTPEKSVRLQLRYGADVVICLDDCTHPEDPLRVQEESVRRTVLWARRCRAEFDRLVAQKELSAGARPALFSVIQGGASSELRRRCAEGLLEIGFDGFGYGGWPLDGQGNLLLDIISYTRELVPPSFPMHALGIGHPVHAVACVRAGYGLLDSVMPTRDARHGRLYAFTSDPSDGLRGDWFSHLYIGDERYVKARGPISPFCDCLCCTHYSVAYLRHLFKIGDGLYARLATMHNLRFMMRLMDDLQLGGWDASGGDGACGDRRQGSTSDLLTA